MKVLFLALALVALVVSQGFDSDNCDIEGSWAQYQTSSRYSSGIWEDEQLFGWGMDGDNKWQDFWSFRQSSATSDTHYNRVTCGFRSGDRSLPNYVALCGDCSLTDNSPCNCYPYYDVAENYQEYPGPEPASEAPVAPEGWPSAWAAGNPPFEQFPSSDGFGAWTLYNCQQYKPQYVYYYTYRLKISSRGTFQKSMGISRAFIPSQASWNAFCEEVFANQNGCFAPSSAGGTSSSTERALFGAEYQYQSGEWRDSESSLDVQFYHNHFESGCHMKSRSHRYPSAVYCGDAAGWKFGAGTTAHVRFGCDVGTFFDTETDQGRDIDDSDCGSVYVAFDQVNPLELTADQYDQYRYVQFPPMATLVRDECWYESTFIDHRSNLPNYRTPCSAGVLAVPFVALLSTILMVLRNMF